MNFGVDCTNYNLVIVGYKRTKSKDMKSLSLKKGWQISIPRRLRGKSKSKSATRFCIFPKVRSAGHTPGNTPVYLNVYDLTPLNGYVYWSGIGIFHSGVEGDSLTHSLINHSHSDRFNPFMRLLYFIFIHT